MKTYKVPTLIYEVIRELERTVEHDSRPDLQAYKQLYNQKSALDIQKAMRHDDLWHGLVITLVGATPALKIVHALPPIGYELTPWAVLNTLRRGIALQIFGNPEPASQADYWREGELAQGLETLTAEYALHDIGMIHRYRHGIEQMEKLDEDLIFNPPSCCPIHAALGAERAQAWQHQLSSPERILIIGDALRAIESTHERFVFLAKAMLAAQYQMLDVKELIEVLRLLRQTTEAVTRDENAKSSSLN